MEDEICTFLMFQSRLGSDRCLTPEGWKESMSSIQHAVFVLTENRECKVLDIVVNSLYQISNASTFQSLISFCKSKSCDAQARSTLKDLIILYCRSLQEISEQPSGSNLSDELRRRIEKSSDSNAPLLSDDDKDLFTQISKAVSPIASPDNHD